MGWHRISLFCILVRISEPHSVEWRRQLARKPGGRPRGSHTPPELSLFLDLRSPNRSRIAPTSSRFSLSTIGLLPLEGHSIFDRLLSFVGDDRAAIHKRDAPDVRSNNLGGK